MSGPNAEILLLALKEELAWHREIMKTLDRPAKEDAPEWAWRKIQHNDRIKILENVINKHVNYHREPKEEPPKEAAQ